MAMKLKGNKQKLDVEAKRKNPKLLFAIKEQEPPDPAASPGIRKQG